MMKRILTILALTVFTYTLSAQGVFSIQSVPVCWSTGSVDSSLVANWLISSNQAEPVVLSYLNAEGQAVTVVGGSLKNGYCCCQSSGGAAPISYNNNFSPSQYLAIRRFSPPKQPELTAKAKPKD